MKEKTGNEKHPCENCPIRQMYQKCYDMHFYGASCPYECKKYEEYRREKDERNN